MRPFNSLDLRSTSNNNVATPNVRRVFGTVPNCNRILGTEVHNVDIPTSWTRTHKEDGRESMQPAYYRHQAIKDTTQIRRVELSGQIACIGFHDVSS